MKTKLILIIFLLPAIILTSCKNEAKNTPALFEIEGKFNKVFILGSVHASDSSIFPMPLYIENAFKQSSELYLEFDPAEHPDSAIYKWQFYPEGESIKENITSETFNLLTDYASKNRTVLGILSGLKPWYCADYIIMDELKREGITPLQGVESHFYRKAIDMNITVKGLQPVGDYSLIFSGQDKNEDDVYLRNTIQNRKKIVSETKQLLLLWRRGDLEEMEDIMNTWNKDTPKLYNKMNGDRNIKFTLKIEELLQKKTNCFIIFGCGHLVGHNNVLVLLASKGYLVKRV